MKTLKYESRGPEVELLQLGLTRAGTEPGPIDGIFGGRTRVSLQRFQQSSGLDPDGIFGPKSQNALLPYLRGYTRHEAVRGDSFFRLAKTYSTTPEAIAAANPGIPAKNVPLGQMLIIPFGFKVVPKGVSYTYCLSELVLDGLKARYPFLRGGSLGRSVMGKRLSYLRIGSGPREVFYNAAHHANEWITSPLLASFAEDYAIAILSHGDLCGHSAQSLFSRTTLFLAPMIDPDGVDLVTGALDSGPFYDRALEIAGGFPEIPFPQGWKANIQGTDLNLNYPAGWERAKEIKFEKGFTSPAPRDYVGTAPLSAPESAAVAAFTRYRDFSLTVSLHTQGQVIYWQYGDIEVPSAYEIGLRFAAASGYALEDTPYESSFAGYKDWFIQDFTRPGYTVEAGLGTNPLPISDLPGIFDRVKPILALGLELA